MELQELIELVTPEAPVPSGAAPGQARQRLQAGLRLGVLDNSKANADHLLRRLLEQLRAELPIASVIEMRKDNPSVGAPASMLEHLAAEADLVFSAMGD